jgi:hypothetical protein
MSAETIASLRDVLHLLNDVDRERATSILFQHATKGWLSDKQIMLLDILARRGASGAQVNAPRVKSAIGDLRPLMALFDRARAKLKYPSLVIGDAAGASYRLKIAGGKARVPGSVNVVGIAYAGEGDWYGRILTSGEFEASPRVATPSALVPALVEFARDPARAAGAHAKATGKCAFCSLPIGEGEDPRARAVGYGEVCAHNWGLPFPSKANAARANFALLSGQATP